MPLPAPHLRLVQAAVKMANAPELSLRGGQRPTWRPERAARGSALGVQSREGSSVFAGVSLLSDRILRDSHVASLLGMTNLRASRHRMRIADIASLHGGHGPPCRLSLSKKSLRDFSPSCFQNCKMKFCSIILQFCRCGGLLNAKGNPDGFLSHFSSLRNLRLGRFFDSLGRLCGCTVSPQFVQPASRVTAMPASTLKP